MKMLEDIFDIEIINYYLYMILTEELIKESESVLVIEKMDPRTDTGTKYITPQTHVRSTDWRMWSTTSFGNVIARNLHNIGNGYSCEVADMGNAVSVKMTYNNPGTGKSVSKTYIILFDAPNKPDGTLFVSMTKWRTFSNYSQAVSYISSSIKGYAGQTTNV